MITNLWITQSYLQFYLIKFDTWYSVCKVRWTCGSTSLIDKFNEHLAQWWTGNTWGGPESYNINKGICHQTHFLTVYSSMWVQTCGSTSLLENFNPTNLKLGTVLNWDQQTVNENLTTQTRSNLMVLNYQWKTALVESVISQIISQGRSKRFPRKALDKSTRLLKRKKRKKMG